jgi:hypothetical protein
MNTKTIVGTCDGTGAAINVIFGAEVQSIIVRNIESNAFETLQWNKNQAVLTNDEGMKSTGANPTLSQLTSNGISAYAGGDLIIYDGDTNLRWETVSAGAPSGTSAEEVYVNGHYIRDAAGDAAYQCIGDAEAPSLVNDTILRTGQGITIGADANVNVDGEQLMWEAVISC